MKTFSNFTGLLLFLMVSLFACQVEDHSSLMPPSEPSIKETNAFLEGRGVTQVQGEFGFYAKSCIEELYFSGNYHFVFRDFKVSPSGRASGGLHLDAQGTGVGKKSGAQYLWRDNWTEQTNFSFVNGQGHQTLRYNLRIIGQGNIPNLTSILEFQITINANGELVVDKIQVLFNCK